MTTYQDQKLEKQHFPNSAPESLGSVPANLGRDTRAIKEGIVSGAQKVAKGTSQAVSEFKRGYQGEDASPAPADSLASVPVASGPPAGPPTEKSAVESFLNKGSQAAGPDVNAGSLQDIPSADVKYAGKYGDTDVLASVGVNEAGQKVTSFSDIENLDTLKGGAPAPLPENGNSVVAQTGAVPGGAGLSFSSVPVASERLQRARAEAVARGDHDAALQSYMSKEERNENNERERRQGLIDLASKRDPLGTLAAVDSTDIANKSGLDAYKSSLNEEVRKARTAESKAIASHRTKVFDKMVDYVLDQSGKVDHKLILNALNQATERGFAGSYETLLTEVESLLNGGQQSLVTAESSITSEDERALNGLLSG